MTRTPNSQLIPIPNSHAATTLRGVTDAPIVGRRQRALVALARFVCARAAWIVLAAFALALASVVYTVAKIEFITDRNDLVDPQAEYNQRFLSFVRDFGDQEWMLLMVAPAPGPVDNPGYAPGIPGELTREQMKQAASAVVTRLRARPDLYPEIIERVPPEEFGGTRMLYMPIDDVRAIATQVEASAPVLETVAREPSFAGLLRGMRDSIERGAGDESDAARAGAQLQRLLRGIHESLADPQGAPPPAELFAFKSTDPALDPDGYIFLWQGRLLMVAILPRRDPGALNQVQEPLAFARQAVAEVEADYPQLAIGLSGRPVIYSDEMAASSRDMTVATIVAVILVGLMFIIAFRSALRPLLAVLCLVLALCWTFGATTLFIGHLNIFAMVFAVVLVGLGIDFGIHVLSHYRQGVSHGLTVQAALAEVYSEIGMGTVLGAVTTAAALSTAVLTDFLGLAELGLICGMGIGFCLLAMLVVFPAMLIIVDQRRVGDGDPALTAAMRDIDATPAPRPASSRGARLAALGVLLLMVACACTAVAEALSGRAPFDYNLLELNDPDAAGVHWERMLIQHDQRASYVVSIRGSLQELRDLRSQYEALPEVRYTESILPGDEDAKRAALARVHAVLPEEFSQPRTCDAAALRSAARGLQAALKQLATRSPGLEAAFEGAALEAGSIVELARQRPGHVDARLAEIEPAFFDGLLDQLRLLKRDSDPPAPGAETLPKAMRARYVGRDPDGNTLYALYVFPAKDAWVRENSGEFVAAVRAVDPHVTGVVVQIHESGTLIVAGFATSVLFALVAIFVLLLIDLRRPLALLIALLPLLSAMAGLLGVMALTDLSFNFANFFGVPILIGTTVDAGVYLVHAQRHGDPRRTLRQTRSACLLCGLTTLFGFGALVTASHNGIVSLGVVLVTGSIAGMLASCVTVPAILAWFNERGRRV